MRRCLTFAFLWCSLGQELHPENAASQIEKPYVLLISLDAFRYDYAERYQATNLIQLGHKGIRAKALIPSFPTTTFPNHYTIVTGLYPAHHGIVENTFWDPARKALFRFNDAATATDGTWWGGTPLWVLAEQQGMRAASYFWPGSDADIQRTRPTYYHRYDGTITKDQQIAEVIYWLKLPKAQRPHFMTLYFSDVDHEGHMYGPESAETRAAVGAVDAALGKLLDLIRGTGVPVNIFVVSDHGMIEPAAAVDLASLADLTGLQTAVAGTDFKVYSRDGAKIDKLYDRFHDDDARFAAYRQSEIPARLHYSGNDRIGDLVVLSMKPVLLRGPLRAGEKPRPMSKGMHGFDVALVPEMRGIFYAQGPDLQSGKTLEEFENIHIFPLIAHLLGLRMPANIDGELAVLAPIHETGNASRACPKMRGYTSMLYSFSFRYRVVRPIPSRLAAAARSPSVKASASMMARFSISVSGRIGEPPTGG